MPNTEAINELIGWIQEDPYSFDISECDTCIMGLWKQGMGIDLESHAQDAFGEALGISPKETTELVMPKGWMTYLSEREHIPRTAEEAVTVLEHLRDTGEVKWN